MSRPASTHAPIRLQPCLSASGSLLLALPMSAFAWTSLQRLDWDGTLLRRKPELHVTLLDSEAAARCLDAGVDVTGMAGQTDWQLVRSGDAALLAEADGRCRRSLVEWVRLDGFAGFRQRVAAAAGITLPQTPAHVTWFASDDKGIGLPDLAHVQRLQRASLRLPGLRNRTPRLAGSELAQRLQCIGQPRLSPALPVRPGRHCQQVDAWLSGHDAQSASWLTAAVPFAEAAPESPISKRIRHALLQAQLAEAGIRRLPAADGDHHHNHAPGLWLPDVSATVLDGLLLDHEQLAALQVQRGSVAGWVLHPQLRG